MIYAAILFGRAFPILTSDGKRVLIDEVKTYFPDPHPHRFMRLRFRLEAGELVVDQTIRARGCARGVVIEGRIVT